MELDSFPVIYISLFVFGTYTALQNTASMALYSDSIPQGSRAKWLSRVSIAPGLDMGNSSIKEQQMGKVHCIPA